MILTLSALLLFSPLAPQESPTSRGTKAEEFSRHVESLTKRLYQSVGADRLDILEQLAETIYRQSPQNAAKYAQEALALLKKYPDQEFRYKTRLLIHLARASARTLPADQAMREAESALEAAHKTNNPEFQAEALEIIGHVFTLKNDLANARKFYQQSLQLHQKNHNLHQSAILENHLGIVHWRLGDYAAALKKIFDALKTFEKENDDYNAAQAYMGLGAIYADLEDYDKSLEYSQKALSLQKEFNNPYNLARLYNNIAFCRLHNNQYDQALDFFQKSIQYKIELNDLDGLANSYDNMGDLHEKKGEYEKALKYYLLSRNTLEKLSNPRHTPRIALTLILTGKMKRLLGQHREALDEVKHALGLASSINNNEALKNAHRELAEICEALNDPKQALYHYQQFKTLNDTIFDQNSRKKIAELQINYEMEKKEKELNLLKKESEIRELKLDRQKTFQDSFLLISALILILAFVTYRRYRFKSKLTGVLKKEIEEHRVTSRKLRESEEKFRVLAEKSVVGIAIIQNNSFRYINPRFTAIFGYSREELRDKTLPDLAAEENREQVRQNLQTKANGETIGATHIEFRGKTKNGETIHLESYGAVTHYEGQPAILETIIDITDRKQAEAELLKARKLETVGILAGSIAQDFDRLLDIINENIFSAIQDTQDLPQALKMLESANKASNQAGELAKKLMTFSEGGWIQPQNTTVATLLKNTLAFHPELKPYLSEITIPENIHPIHADERQFRQVFHNLLLNAVEAVSGVNSIRFRCNNIRLTPQHNIPVPDGEYVRIIITDSGKGIPRRHIEKIFDPYFSTKNNVTQKGIGLGLALCYSIIKKHNGHIGIMSTEGEGTTVEIYLPAHPVNS